MIAARSSLGRECRGLGGPKLVYVAVEFGGVLQQIVGLGHSRVSNSFIVKVYALSLNRSLVCKRCAVHCLSFLVRPFASESG
jgi:hypothetical protein